MPTEIAVEESGDTSHGWRRVGHLLRESLVKFYTDDSLTVSASIAYYSVLSVFPLLLLLLGLSGIYIQRRQLAGHLAFLLERVLPMKPDFILSNLTEISKAYGRVGLVSFLLLLWSSAGVFLPLEKALNRAWEVERERSWLHRRLLALGMALLVGFLILVSSDLVGITGYIHNWSIKWLRDAPVLGILYHFLGTLTGFALTLIMFVILFATLPDRRMQLGQILPGALLTAVVWQAARSVFAILFHHFNYRHVYGSIGAVVAFMTWAYVSAAIMLFGARASSMLYRALGRGAATRG